MTSDTSSLRERGDILLGKKTDVGKFGQVNSCRLAERIR